MHLSTVSAFVCLFVVGCSADDSGGGLQRGSVPSSPTGTGEPGITPPVKPPSETTPPSTTPPGTAPACAQYASQLEDLATHPIANLTAPLYGLKYAADLSRPMFGRSLDGGKTFMDLPVNVAPQMSCIYRQGESGTDYTAQCASDTSAGPQSVFVISDGKAAWTSLTNYSFASKFTGFSYGTDMAPNGTFFAVGGTGADVEHWVVDSATQGGAAKTVDDFLPAGQFKSEAHGVRVSSKGTVYVAGVTWASAVFAPSVLVLRRSDDNGSTWSTAFSAPLPANVTAAGLAKVGIDSAENVFLSYATYVGSAVSGTIYQYSPSTGKTSTFLESPTLVGNGSFLDKLGYLFQFSSGGTSTEATLLLHKIEVSSKTSTDLSYAVAGARVTSAPTFFQRTAQGSLLFSGYLQDTNFKTTGYYNSVLLCH